MQYTYFAINVTLAIWGFHWNSTRTGFNSRNSTQRDSTRTVFNPQRIQHARDSNHTGYNPNGNQPTEFNPNEIQPTEFNPHVIQPTEFNPHLDLFSRQKFNPQFFHICHHLPQFLFGLSLLPPIFFH